MKYIKINLLNYEQGNGAEGLRKTGEKTVWAQVGDIGVTTKMAALTAGKEAQLQALALRAEYAGQSHVSIGDTVYKIAETGAADNPLRIKLLLKRGMA